MAQDIQSLMQGEELKETLFGFGGNMVIRSSLAARSFYPFAVPRGEHIYLMGYYTKEQYKNIY